MRAILLRDEIKFDPMLRVRDLSFANPDQQRKPPSSYSCKMHLVAESDDGIFDGDRETILPDSSVELVAITSPME